MNICVCACVCVCVCVCGCVCEEVKHEISGSAIGTKFASAYTSIFMDERETNFLDKQEFKLVVWFRYIEMFSLFGYMVKKTVRVLKKILITTTPALNLPTSSIKKAFPFWTLR